MNFTLCSAYFWVFVTAVLILSFSHRAVLTELVFRNRIEIGWLLAATALFVALSWDVLKSADFLPRHDNWKYAYPFFHFFLESLSQTNTLPAWNPYVNGGMPTFLFLNHVFLFHLPHLLAYVFYPLCWTWMTPLQMYWFALLFGNLFFSFGAYAFFRSLFQDRRACLYGFVVCLFSGLTVGTLHQEQLMASLLYIPWILFFVMRFARSRRLAWGILAALFFGLSLLNHYPHLVVYFWGIIFLSSMIFLRQKIRKLKPLWPIFTVSALIFLTPVGLLYAHYKPLLVSPARDPRSLSVAASYDQIMGSMETNSFNVHTLLHYVYPQTFFAIPQDHQMLGQARLDNFVFYIGLLPLFLALYETFKGRSTYRRPVLLSAGLLFILALGGNSFGYFLLYQLVPFSNLQRLPVHLANYCNFLLVLLSVGGAQTFLSPLRYETSEARNSAGQFLALPGLGLYGKYAVVKPIVRAALDETLLFMGMLWTFFWIKRQPRTKILVGLIFFLVLFDLGRYTHFVMSNEKVPVEAGMDLSARPPGPLPVSKEIFEFVPGKTAYQSMIWKRPVLALTKGPLMELKEGHDFLVQNEALLFSKKKYPELLLNWKLDPGSGEARSVIYAGDRAEFEVLAKEPSRFVWRDNSDAGWKVSVNGRRAELVDAKPFKAVNVAPGKNRVVFIYDPQWKWSLHLVLQVFFLGTSACLLVLYWNFLNEKNTTHSAPGH